MLLLSGQLRRDIMKPESCSLSGSTNVIVVILLQEATEPGVYSRSAQFRRIAVAIAYHISIRGKELPA